MCGSRPPRTSICFAAADLALAGLIIGWNVIEAVVAITAGIAAGSIAVMGLGFDAIIGVIGRRRSSLWQFRQATHSSGYGGGLADVMRLL